MISIEFVNENFICSKNDSQKCEPNFNEDIQFFELVYVFDGLIVLIVKISENSKFLPKMYFIYKNYRSSIHLD